MGMRRIENERRRESSCLRQRRNKRYESLAVPNWRRDCKRKYRYSLINIFIVTEIWHLVMAEIQHHMVETYRFRKAKLTQ